MRYGTPQRPCQERLETATSEEQSLDAMMFDLEKLAAVPTPTLIRSAAVERGIADSVAYLGSDAAQRSIELDSYWPKWNSPWWHMLLLHELGEASRIPTRASAAMVAAINR